MNSLTSLCLPLCLPLCARLALAAGPAVAARTLTVMRKLTRSGVEAGRRLYTEHAVQLNGIDYFGPRDTIRMILRKARTKRKLALCAPALAATSTGGTRSFVYGHTAGLDTAAYLGLIPSDGDTPGYSPKRRQNELFVKLSWQI